MTRRPETPEIPMGETPVDDRTLRLNEAAIIDVRREVASAVQDIDRALVRLREVLDTRLPELRHDDDPEESA